MGTIGERSRRQLHLYRMAGKREPMLRVSTRVFSEKGHRQSYLSVLNEALAAHGFELSAPSNSARADFFPMIEDSVIRFAVAALVSSIRGRPCVGLLFRP